MLLLIGALLIDIGVPLTTFFLLLNLRKNDPGFRKNCRKLLLKGLLLGFPVFGFSLLCSLFFSLTGLGAKYPVLNSLFRAFILMALSEELMKYLPAARMIDKNRESVSFLDIIAYTTASAVGFHILESVFYGFSTSAAQILVRGVTNMHAVFGMIMGFLLAKGYAKNRKAPAVMAVLVPAFIHGLYDFGLEEPVFDTVWGDISLLLAIICFVLNIVFFFRIRKAEKDPGCTAPLFPAESGADPESPF